MKHLKQNWRRIAGTTVLLVAIIASVVILTPRLEIKASQGTLAISLGINNPNDVKQITKLTETTIGNIEPSIKFNRWDGESSIELVPVISDIFNKASLGDSITFDGNSYAFEFTPTPIKAEFNTLGGYDIFITIKESLATNKLYFIYNSKAVVAYPQPALDTIYRIGDKEFLHTVASVNETHVVDAKGFIMVQAPIHAVDSICFYSATKRGDYTAVGGQNYYSGKVGQLWRVKCFDSHDNWAWCAWNLEDSYITLTIPQKFLDTASYPLEIRPIGDTFGYTSTPTEDYNSASQNYAIIPDYVFTGAAGDGVSMHIYAKSDTNGHHISCAVYDDQDPGTFITNANVQDIDLGTDYGWVEGNFAIAPTFEAVDYHLAWNSEHDDNNILFDWGDEGYYYGYQSQTYGSWANEDWAWTGATRKHFGIYVTYTVAGGEPSATVDPTTENIGVVSLSNTYYAAGSAPNNPVEDGDCTFTITNDGSITENITISMTDLSAAGEYTYALVAGSPSTREFRMTAYYTGLDPASGVVLTNAAQSFYNGLASSANISFDFKIEMGTWDTSTENNTARTGVLQLTAIEP